MGLFLIANKDSALELALETNWLGFWPWERRHYSRKRAGDYIKLHPPIERTLM
jgi:hypothetical protein